MYPKEKCSKFGILKHKAHGAEEYENCEFVMKRNVMYKQTEQPHPSNPGETKKIFHQLNVKNSFISILTVKDGYESKEETVSKEDVNNLGKNWGCDCRI